MKLSFVVSAGTKTYLEEHNNRIIIIIIIKNQTQSKCKSKLYMR